MFLFRLARKYKRLLSIEEWHKLPLIVLLMIVAGLFETLSVAVMLPFMEIVVKPEQSMRKTYVQTLIYLFNIENTNELLITIAVFLAILYIIKNIYLIWEIHIQQRFISGSMLRVQTLFLSALLRKPYSYFMSVKSGDLFTMMYNKVSGIFNMLSSVFSMLSELIIAGMLALSLIIITPKISLLMFAVLLIVLLIIAKIIKPILKHASENNQLASSSMYKWLLQAIQGIKEIKIQQSEDYFIDNYSISGDRYVEALCKYTVWSNVPRAIIEASAMFGFFSTVAVFIAVGNKLSNMIPILTAIAMAAIRLLPATNRITTGIANVAYSEPYLDEVLFFLNEIFTGNNDTEDNTSSHIINRINIQTEIRMEDVSYHYPKSEGMVLNDASFTIKCGESIGIVGASGAGKTTVVDILLGLLIPQKGSITVDGVDIRDDVSGWVEKIGYIPQYIFLLDDSILMNVAFGIPRDMIDESEAWRALDEAALGEFVRSLPDGIHTSIGERGMRLSGGQRQRLGIARALYRNPQILFFDEATSALDNETEEAVMESVRGLKGLKTMVIIAHRLTTIEDCDHVYRVEGGKITKER